jgi:hypothetical protein
MNVLFVTPSETGTGEALTAIAMARDLQRRGHDAYFAASPVTARFVRQMIGGAVAEFGDTESLNRACWQDTVRLARPDVIVFADYPLLFMTSGTIPLASANWVDDLRQLRVRLATLDHLGFAQGPGVVYFGPPHLTFHAQSFAPVPDDMAILLPCPLFSGGVAGWKGTPFRYWDVPLTIPDEVRDATRRQYLNGRERFLVVHSTPRWAIRMAAEMCLPHYDHLPRLLAHYLHGLPAPAVLVSVNDGALLPDSTPDLRVMNLPPLPPDSFERLLLSADVVLSDNTVSVSLAKAVCGRIASVALINSFRLPGAAGVDDDDVAAVVNEMERRRPGSVFPYAVFPIWTQHDLDQLGWCRQGPYASAVIEAELFGGPPTARVLVDLLVDPASRARLHRAQDAYIDSISRLPGAAEVLGRL